VSSRSASIFSESNGFFSLVSGNFCSRKKLKIKGLNEHKPGGPGGPVARKEFSVLVSSCRQGLSSKQKLAWRSVVASAQIFGNEKQKVRLESLPKSSFEWFTLGDLGLELAEIKSSMSRTNLRRSSLTWWTFELN
jgi:hypothetical protein